ncbi:DMT family transporter [Mycetocola reblochoni]|uniref:Integral membrane protein n=1 Tax=Mycetocola reblochoni REB411 TaxID=1255698 RepID=A0A1R4K4H3_9MICO|nr:DMT family transporter [Mycetocola reblochoni]SJN39136.1 Integral membrane protein [Mycetocola reblochoni REB411]
MLLADNDLTDLTEQFTRDPSQLIGIPLALAGAVLLSFGAQYQHRGVAKVEARSQNAVTGLNGSQLLSLLKRPSWVAGTLMLGLAIVLQLSALSFSPLILVQPLGAVALVVTAVLNSRVARVTLNRASKIAIGACAGGVALFVVIAWLAGGEKQISDRQLITVLVILAVVLVLAITGFVMMRDRSKAVFYIIAAGSIYGFVATLAKVIINRFQHGNVDGLTVLCLVGLLAATGIGAYFVQNAYSSGPPDLVIAGLTVIDPMVAVAIGIIVLGEAQGASGWAYLGFVVAGAIAVWGVFQLARHHPQVRN